jgi:hypothetical protein
MTEIESGEMPATDAIAPETELVESSTTPETETPAETGQQTEAERDERGRFTGAQKRFDELTREKYDARREAEYWREMAMRSQPQPEPVKAEPVATPEPDLEDFGYDQAKFKAAWNEWSRATIKAEIAAELKAEREAAKAAEREQRHAERVQKYATQKPDFVSKVNDPYLPVSPPMAEVIKDSDYGAELLEWIADNREAAQAIYRLPPHVAHKELGKIEDRIEAAKRRPAVPAVSKAPPPPPTVEAVEPEVDKDPENMAINDWVKWREKQLRKRR